MSTFVEIYHPSYPSTATTPARVAAQAVDEWYAKGWLLVDPEATPPTPDTPYYTTAAADSRFAKVDDIDDPETLTGERLRAAFGLVINVQAAPYNAKGDGTTDDTAAIQAAINAAAAAKKSVFLPPGTYRLVPNTSAGVPTITLKAGLQGIVGAGAGASTIKVASGAGDYYGLFGNGGQDVAGLLLTDFTIDQNNTNNQWTNAATNWTTRPRLCVEITSNSTPVIIQRVHIVDMDSVNPLYLVGGHTEVRDCYFAFGSSPVDHDCSVVFMRPDQVQGGQAVVDNNIFTSPGAGSKSAWTAIETHGGAQTISNNVIHDFMTGLNITGFSLWGREGGTVYGNKIYNARVGIKLWSGSDRTNTTRGLSHFIIRDNVIKLKGSAWASLVGGVGYAQGILRDPSAQSNLPFEDILIADNTIVYDNTGYTGQSGDTGGNGIYWYGPSYAVTDRRVTIRGNKIDSPNACGIRIDAVADGFEISGNLIRNPGQSSVAAGGALPNFLANGIMLNGKILNSRADNNLIADDQTTPTTQNGIWVLADLDGSLNNRAFDNVIPVAATKIDITQSTHLAPWIVRYSDAGSPLGVLRAPVGSTYMRKDGGAGTTMYVKESGIDTTGWVGK